MLPAEFPDDLFDFTAITVRLARTVSRTTLYSRTGHARDSEFVIS